ncbi:MAG: ATP-binding protein [Muribaculaceae bacterium]|nr:ATP-binding protein [Muribaculaceae bacterium]
MFSLIEKYRQKIDDIPLDFIRAIHSKIDWEERLLAILGGRGVGKSTMILQHIKKYENIDRCLYVSADDLWFSVHSIYELASEFHKEGGFKLFIDEIHKYNNWSQEIKNIYDDFPKMKVIYTGSSILDLQKGNADLSRRLLQYNMYGLSFREYLKFSQNLDIPIHSLDDIIENKIRFPVNEVHPLPLFKKYLREGYYPYFKASSYYQRLSNVVNRVLEIDIPLTTGISVSRVEKLKKLLYIIVQSVPFKPNYSKIGRDLDISRNDVADLMIWLEKSQLINILREEARGIGLLGKVEKIFLSNTNLSFALSDNGPDIGNLRETVFFSLLKESHKIFASKESDFQVGKYTFEVGGKGKKQTQIKGIENAFLVKDDIEYGFGNIRPLWAFGLLY